MAKKISQLTQATQVKSDDVTVIVQDGETKKLPLNMMVTKQDIEDKKVAGLAKLDEIEATYENDTYTPTITVKNKSSVKVGEGDGVDYSANVMDGHAKSAILKGNSIKNYKNNLFDNVLEKGMIDVLTGEPNELNLRCYRSVNFIPINGNFKIAKYGIYGDLHVCFYDSNKSFLSAQTYVLKKVLEGNATVIPPTNSSFIKFYNPYDDNEPTGEFGFGVMAENEIIELVIQSVKMPVLTTSNSTIKVEEFILGSTDSNGNIIINEPGDNLTNFIKVSGNTKYTIKFNNFNKLSAIVVNYYDENRNFIIRTINPANNVLTTPSNCEFVVIRFYSNPKLTGSIELYLTDNGYEPHKSNILTVNEDVELRGIGDVRDELNCLTGELTERVKEIVLDGTEAWNVWYHTDTLLRFRLPCSNMLKSSSIKLICDKFISYGYNQNKEGIFGTDNVICLIIDNSNNKLSGTNVGDLKTYLSQNPITVQYPLQEKPIKTVDLIPSGTHPSTTPYCWKDGHIQLSSSGLLPSLEYSVVTSRAGQISQNAAMIVKNDKRIFDLEILLAGGLVNTTYQALTLQNQVETGLSKVSLSSEKEPDYLLYHMIMKLIEEKAYKLDDLAEKVSVFYLYEKLSDEQFETIYSELYPFVEEEYIELPEDGEIIEEPIVDEVLEEVENGVVM